MRRTGGLAVSRGYEVDDARPELVRQRGRVVFTANGIGPGRPIAGGAGQRGRVVRVRTDDYRGAALKRRQDIQDFGIGREANDNRMSVGQKLRVLCVFVHRVGNALKAVARGQSHGQPRR